MSTDVLARIKQEVSQNPVVLYMKGTPDFPQCGFSYRVAEILNQFDISYHAVDVLSDQAVREGIKVFGQWPTIPQLYISGELIGGCDIVCQMNDAGTLLPIIQQAVQISGE